MFLLQPKGSTLTIQNAQDSDAGIYACQLSPNDNRELKQKVEIRKLLKITKEPSTGVHKAFEGKD